MLFRLIESEKSFGKGSDHLSKDLCATKIVVTTVGSTLKGLAVFWRKDFLDRLERLGVDWTSDGRMITLLPLNSSVRNVQYNIGDLLNLDDKPTELISAITSTIDPSSWLHLGGISTAVLLGDVLPIRQVDRTHRRIAAFLEGLRHPARRTWIDESKEHEAIRAVLDSKTTMQFKGVPLVQAVQTVSAQHQINIRLDRVALRNARISERLAIFDVRDLCKNLADCSKLQQAIEGQADPGSWETAGGTGVIDFPSVGIIVISQRERVIDEVSTLLDNYRSALKNSKRRLSPDVDPEVYETKYYRMPTVVARDLHKLLPKLIEKDTCAVR